MNEYWGEAHFRERRWKTSPNCLIKDSTLSSYQRSNSFDVLFEWSSFKIFNTSSLGIATGACHYGHLSRSKAGLIWLASKLKRIIQLSAATVYHQLLALCLFWIRTSPEGAELRKRSPTSTLSLWLLLREINEEFPLLRRSRLWKGCFSPLQSDAHKHADLSAAERVAGETLPVWRCASM